tara:strand:+ start:354 stop:827 length:474 start_codon:yes stop_codon:yes gene_type:complete
MEIRALQISDSSSIWEINEQGLPGTGKVSEQEILDLLNYSSLSIGLFDSNSLLGFVICLPPKTAYGSLNYLWFNERYDDFLYVDRIAVSTANRDQKIGSKLYQAVIDTASKLGVPIAAEVNLRPPNPDSVRFHQRHGFTEIGQFEHGQKAVIMMLKQ